jgi:hypothetical protein
VGVSSTATVVNTDKELAKLGAMLLALVEAMDINDKICVKRGERCEVKDPFPKELLPKKLPENGDKPCECKILNIT